MTIEQLYSTVALCKRLPDIVVTSWSGVNVITIEQLYTTVALSKQLPDIVVTSCV